MVVNYDKHQEKGSDFIGISNSNNVNDIKSFVIFSKFISFNYFELHSKIMSRNIGQLTDNEICKLLKFIHQILHLQIGSAMKTLEYLYKHESR